MTTDPTGAAATYKAEFTAAQIFGFADLVRRLNQAHSPDADRFLRTDLTDALFTFLNLLPEPSDEDGDAYLAAMRAGELPNWGMDDQPLTETTEAAPAKPGKGNEDAAAKLAEIRGVLSAFDWERDDRQFALEEIEHIVTAGGES